MRDRNKNKQQLIAEIEELRRQVAAFDKAGTDRTRAEQTLQTSESLYRRLYESMRDAFVSVDMDGWIREYNEAYREMLGYEPGELAAFTYMDLTPSKWHAFQAEVIEKQVLTRGYSDIYEKEYRRKDGSVFPVELRTVLLRDDRGEPCGMWAILRDITERKRAEEAIRFSEAKYRRLHQSMMDAVVSVDMDGRIQEFNDVYQKMLGYEPEELLTLRYIDVTPEEWHPFEAGIVQKQILTRGYSDTYEKEYRRKDGTAIPVELRTFLITDDKNQPCGMWAIVRDITERKRAEEALKKAHDELEDKVKERTAELAIFHKFAEASGRGFGMADLEGRITYVNPTLCRMFGEKRPEDVVGKHVCTYYPADYEQKRKNKILPVLLREGSWQGEQAVLARNGTLTPTYQNSFLIRDENGRPIRLGVAVADISEHKKAEAALRQSEEKYRTLIQTSPDGVIMTDLGGHITFASAQVLDYYGGDVPAEILGRTPLDFMAKEDHQRFLGNLRRTVDEGATRDVEYDFIRQDGKHFAGAVSAAVIRDASGKPNALVAILRDITERKAAAAALQQSHEELRAIYEGLSDGVLVADSHTRRFLRTNPAICEMSGYSERELLSLSVNALHPRESLPKVLDSFRQIAEGKLWIAEDIPVLRRDGTVFYADIASNRLNYHGRPCVIGFFRDVTERRRAAETLRQSEERFELVVRGAGVGIWDWNIRTGKVYYSPRWKTLFGYEDDEIGNGTEDWARLLHPDERESIVKFQEDFLAGTSSSTSVEYRLRRKDGSYRWIIAHAVVVRDEEGKACRLVGSHGDITDRKLAEEALKREHRTMEHLLRASDHERQLIAYDIHDGLAQYLTGAIMHFQMAEQLRAENSREASKAHDAGMLMVRQSLAETRRLISGVRPPILDESGVVAAVAHLVYEYRGRRGPKIELHSEVEFGRLAAVLENSIYRIVQEGLANACHHSESKKVRIELVQHGDQVRVAIRDSGKGFDPQQVPDDRYGLEGIRERARLLGGIALIDSTLGKGTSIVVELPVIPGK